MITTTIIDTRFKAQEKGGASCSGCLFHKASYRECVHAADTAVQRGMPDCDDRAPNGKTYIYVADETDPRQLDLLAGSGRAV